MSAMFGATKTAMAADSVRVSRMPKNFSMPAMMMAPAAHAESVFFTSKTDVITSVSFFALVISVRTLLLAHLGVLLSLLSLVGLLALIGLTGLISLVGLLQGLDIRAQQGD